MPDTPSPATLTPRQHIVDRPMSEAQVIAYRKLWALLLADPRPELHQTKTPPCDGLERAS
jgi:hypothetical protein